MWKYRLLLHLCGHENDDDDDGDDEIHGGMRNALWRSVYRLRTRLLVYYYLSVFVILSLKLLMMHREGSQHIMCFYCHIYSRNVIVMASFYHRRLIIGMIIISMLLHTTSV